MTHNVTQARRPDRTIFHFHELREFVDSATALHFPDATPVRCFAGWDGKVKRLETVVEDARDTDSDGPPASPPANAHGADRSDAEKRTSVTQKPTGPEVEWRRWGRRLSAHVLTLGDIRALLARADKLGLPTYQYAVRALPVDRSWRGHVYSISVEPYA
ncbi:hypothetical protein [Amycolatopsis nalaikhensis]|uniref:Uncharacterized protein n=1 Tax=Amycolatopsis nalaikhensis TaxID=715472 RepID=A0ABY8XYS9_9PSEU|nr:hypothetical protein [Amycolatopsis sp. 2-2]WIV60909.1 hypothetical protein QP939_21040 [Amycolatopsis sp. 2-2]